MKHAESYEMTQHTTHLKRKEKSKYAVILFQPNTHADEVSDTQREGFKFISLVCNFGSTNMNMGVAMHGHLLWHCTSLLKLKKFPLAHIE